MSVLKATPVAALLLLLGSCSDSRQPNEFSRQPGPVPSTDAATSISLPSGVLFIPLDSVDTDRGAFHDAESGALVKSEIAHPHVVLPWVSEALLGGENKRTSDTLLGRRIDRVLVRLASTCEVERLSVHNGSDAAPIWNFEAHYCGPAARTRVEALLKLLLSPASPWTTAGLRPRFLGVKPLDRLTEGMRLSDLLPSLRTPDDIRPADGGGLELSYETEAEHGSIVFTRDQRVSSVTVRR